MRHLGEGALQAWLDRDRSGLSAGERADIERHLAGCDACARRLDEMDELSRRAEALLAAPEAADEAIPPYVELAERADRHRAAGRRRSAWIAGGWAASVAAALGVGWMANDLHRPDRVAGAPEGSPAAEAPAARVLPAPEPPRAPAPGAGRPTADAPARAPTGARGRSPTQSPTAASSPTRVADAAAPGTPPVLRGRVTDESGRPLAAAQVFVPGTGAGALTGADGSFSMPLEHVAVDSAAGSVTVVAELVGYREERRSVPLDGAGGAAADFRLAQQSIALDEVVVTGAAARGITAAPPEIVLAPGGDEEAWRVTTRPEAEAQAGFRLFTVPELRVVRIQVQETADLTLVRVVQELGEGGVLDLVEARGALRFDDRSAEDGRSRASVRRGDVSIAAAAPVVVDTLRALLERVR